MNHYKPHDGSTYSSSLNDDMQTRTIVIVPMGAVHVTANTTGPMVLRVFVRLGRSAEEKAESAKSNPVPKQAMAREDRPSFKFRMPVAHRPKGYQSQRRMFF
jgi:oxalate decarboxylase/phosphoglucose isomerase-like protein (cupin superfamily)